MKLPKALQRKA